MLGTRFVRGSLRKPLLLLGLTGALALIATPAPAAVKPKADFAVKSVKTYGEKGPPHIIRNGPPLGFSIRVKNVGDARGRGRGVLKVMGEDGLSPVRFEFDVPRLKPGRARVIDVVVSSPALRGIINTYKSSACAHARRDPRPANNCRKGPPFALIPRRWAGTTNSVVNDIGGIVITCSTTVSFNYNPSVSGNGKFWYTATGGLSCGASGSGGGCTYSGDGETSIEGFLTALRLDSTLTGYFGIGASSATFDGTRTCPPDPPTDWSFEMGAWLATISTRAMEPGDLQLSGNVNVGGDSWTWNLTAKD